MMAQTAQFTQVQRLQEVAQTDARMLAAQLAQSAVAMVGRTVTYTTTAGTSAIGVVSATTLTGTEPSLRVGSTDVPLSTVTALSTAS